MLQNFQRSFATIELPNLKCKYMDVSENSGTPKSSISIGFSIINHPFWGTTIFGNTYMVILKDFPFNSALVWVGKKK